MTPIATVLSSGDNETHAHPRAKVLGMAALTIIAATGCTALTDIKYSDLTEVGYTLDSNQKPHDQENRKRCQLAAGGPATTQGHSLCNALMRVATRQNEIEKKLTKLAKQRFDFALVGLATLSAAGLAAESHISALQSLGILTATAVGLRNYAGVEGRRSAYVLGHASLSCLRESTEALLWDDKWFYRLRYYRNVLNKSYARMTQYSTSVSKTDSLYTKYKGLESALAEALALADEAIAAYAALGNTVDTKRVALIAGMRGQAEASRDDVAGIVQSILAAEAVKREQNASVDAKSQAVAKTAGANAEQPKDPTLIKSIADEANRDPEDSEFTVGQPSTEVLGLFAEASSDKDRLANTIASAAFAMQQITNIAPRYIKAKNNIGACTLQ